jgi:predicted metal-dependent hydrolase
MLRVRVEPGRVRSHVALRGDELRVAVGARGPAAVRDALERWYRRQARDEGAWRLDDATARVGSRYTKLSIRAQKSRWASCSSSGAMSFNWRLLMAPEEILDYVVEHEVAHLDVLGHSRRFWALVESRCPDYRTHERWLRRYGSTLRL